MGRSWLISQLNVVLYWRRRGRRNAPGRYNFLRHGSRISYPPIAGIGRRRGTTVAGRVAMPARCRIVEDLWRNPRHPGESRVHYRPPAALTRFLVAAATRRLQKGTRREFLIKANGRDRPIARSYLTSRGSSEMYSSFPPFPPLSRYIPILRRIVRTLLSRQCVSTSRARLFDRQIHRARAYSYIIHKSPSTTYKRPDYAIMNFMHSITWDYTRGESLVSGGLPGKQEPRAARGCISRECKTHADLRRERRSTKTRRCIIDATR